MKPSDAREQTIFDAARQLPDPQAQAAYLDSACSGDPILRERVEKLLAASQRADEFLAGDPLGLAGAGLRPTPGAALSEGPGTIIDKYKLLERLGEGGFGVVYMAEQAQPVKRRVALKIIKVGMDTLEVVGRFEAERQALALMDHPNIARVFDGGATETGRLYFVMELVRGTRITDYCDEKSLKTDARLALFTQVCQAVQHAHQKGIIHRDLKPSNILVTVNDGVAVPKIIDFGIAKATQMELTDKTVFTRFQQFLGTPAYMSPEQAELTSVDIDTRSDIYSLGVLLYELLTGKTPFDSKELLRVGLDEMRRTIREKKPPTPRTRVSAMRGDELTTTAKRRGLAPPKLISQLRGDLEWIVMKCLEKDRARRYETANGLAMDIQRHLNNEPVVARPPSRLYEFHKSVRRHKVGFAATGAVIVALACGVAVSLWSAKQQKQLRVVAEQAKSNATEKLWSAYLAEARARRHSGESGQRFETLTAISNAAAIRPSLELRNEAIAAMALTDVRSVEGKTKRFKHKQEFAAVDPAVQRYALAKTNGTISIRRLSDDSELVSLPPIKGVGLLYAVGFIPNGDLFLAGYADRRNRFWDITLAKVVWELPFYDLGFSRDYKTLATVESNNITFYDLTRRERLSRVRPDGAAPGGAAFDPGGRRFAYRSDDTNVVVLDIAHEKTVVKLAHPMTVLGITWHPSENYLAVCCEDNMVYVWDSDNDREVRILEGHTGTPVSVDFSRDGRLLVSAGWDGRMFLWDFRSGRPLVRTWALGGTWFGPDDRSLVSGAWDTDYLDFLELARGQEVLTVHEQARVPGPPTGSAFFSANGRLLAYDTPKSAKVYDAKTQREVGSIDEPVSVFGFGEGDRAVLGVQWTGQGQGHLFRWVIEPRADGDTKAAQAVEFGGKTLGGIGCMSADMRVCAVIGQERAQIFRTDTLTEIARTGLQRGMSSSALSPDGNLLATGPFHGSGIKIWDAHTGQLQKDLPTVEEMATIVFSPDGRWLVVGEGDHYQFWETGTWLLRQRLSRAGFIPAMRFSPDGKILAGTGQFSHVTLFDVATGRELADLEPPTSSMATSLSFSPDGTQLAVAEGHRALRVWDLRAIRQQLAVMHLDWDMPPYPPPVASTASNPSR